MQNKFFNTLKAQDAMASAIQRADSTLAARGVVYPMMSTWKDESAQYEEIQRYRELHATEVVKILRMAIATPLAPTVMPCIPKSVRQWARPYYED